MTSLITKKNNNKNVSLDSEWLRTFKGFENYSEYEAENTIITLQKLANIACRHIINTS